MQRPGDVEARFHHICPPSHPSCLLSCGPLCQNSRKRKCPTGNNFDNKQVQGKTLLSPCGVAPDILWQAKSGMARFVRAELSVLSVQNRPGYEKELKWPVVPFWEDKDLRLMCQQRYIERYEYEVEEATGKRKREGKKLWVPYPAESMLSGGRGWKHPPGQAPYIDFELDPESDASRVLVLGNVAIQYNGNGKPWQLMFRLLRRDDNVDPSMWDEVVVAISEPMQVTTVRAASDSKVRFPRFDDKVGDLHGMGKETVEKLRNIGETMTTMEMVQKHGNVKLPPPELLCVTHVGQLIQFKKWAEHEWPTALLSELLNLKDVEEALQSVIMEKDDRKRLYKSRNYAQYGLMYEGRDGAVPDISLPVALLYFVASGTTYSVDMHLATAQQAEIARQIAVEATEDWHMSGHPNWGIVWDDAISLVQLNGEKFADALQVAPATQSSRVGAQQTHQQLQPQIGTTPLPGIAPGPQPASQVAIGNIQGPEDLSSRSVCPVPCQSSFGHPAHSPERDHKPQAKRLRQQDPSPAPNVLLGVAGEVCAGFASHPHLYQYLPLPTQQGSAVGSSWTVWPSSQASLSVADQQQWCQLETQLIQQSLSAGRGAFVQHADFPNLGAPQPQPQWPHSGLVQRCKPVYSGLAPDQSISVLRGSPYSPIPMAVCNNIAALPFPQAPQEHTLSHTTHTGLAPHLASTAAAASAPPQACLGPPVPAVTADPASVAGQQQPSFQQGHAPGAAAESGDADGYLNTIQGDVWPGSGEMASVGPFPDMMTAESHMGQCNVELDNEEMLSWMPEFDLAPQSSVVAGDDFSQLITSPLPVAEQDTWGLLDSASGNTVAENVVSGSGSLVQPSQGSFPQPSEGSFLQPFGQGFSEFGVQQASTCGSPDSVMQPSEPNINMALPPSNTATARRLTGPIISLYMLVFTFGLLLFSRQHGNIGARHVPRKLLLQADQLAYIKSQHNVGQIPELWSQPAQLPYLETQLTGSLPETWSEVTQLEPLTLDNNQLSGTLPSAWSGWGKSGPLSISRTQDNSSVVNWVNSFVQTNRHIIKPLPSPTPSCGSNSNDLYSPASHVPEEIRRLRLGAVTCAVTCAELAGIWLWLLYASYTRLQKNREVKGGSPDPGRISEVIKALTLWSQYITHIVDVNISAPASILWAFTAAVFASTAYRAYWQKVDTVTYQILPGPVEISSSLVPVLLSIWQLWMLVAFLPSSRGSVGGGVGSVWRSLKQVFTAVPHSGILLAFWLLDRSGGWDRCPVV